MTLIEKLVFSEIYLLTISFFVLYKSEMGHAQLQKVSGLSPRFPRLSQTCSRTETGAWKTLHLSVSAAVTRRRRCCRSVHQEQEACHHHRWENRQMTLTLGIILKFFSFF